MVTVISPAKELPYLKLMNCQDVRVTNCYQTEIIKTFIMKDEKSRNIYLMNNILPGTALSEKGESKEIITNNNITSKSL